MDKNKAQFKVYIYITLSQVQTCEIYKINELITKIVSLYSQVFIRGYQYSVKVKKTLFLFTILCSTQFISPGTELENRSIFKEQGGGG